MKSLINYANKFSARLFIFYLVWLFLFSGTAFGKCNLLQDGKNNSVEELIGCLEEKENSSTRQRAIFALHRLGKDAVPKLIDNISNSKKVEAVLKKPISSGRFVLEPPVGVVSAYIIEAILGRDYLIPTTANHYAFTLGGDSENYVYWDGFIIKSQNEMINDSDLPEIQRIYREWWEKNKDESICDLRENRKKGERILDGKKYKWE